MTELLEQVGSAFAAACCAGAGWALAALTAVGAGVLINDAVLIPPYVALVGLWTSTVVLFLGLGLIVASSFWDYLGAHSAASPKHQPGEARWREPSISS